MASQRPQCLHVDDYAAAEPARQRLAQKHRFPFLRSLRISSSLPSLSKKTPRRLRPHNSIIHDSAVEPIQVHSDLPTIPLIQLDTSAVDQGDEGQNLYQWAILYENQRGATVLSTPYYSRLCLLPTDPAPFTIPSASPDRSKQPDVSLTCYPLPDGDWCWVSKAWMIDMRSDSGDVQHDGFEYNWKFRRTKWSAEVGVLSSGGWVRRRRWIRLMMRPAKPKREILVTEGDTLSPNNQSAVRSRASWIESVMDGLCETASSSPSLATRLSDFQDYTFNAGADEVWQGQDAEQDWTRCHIIMKRLGRDGRKLELWKKWLKTYLTPAADTQDKGKQRLKQWTEDNSPMPSEMPSSASSIVYEAPPPALEHIASVLREHGGSILRSFIFPESRAQFITLLERAGLLQELNSQLGLPWSTSEVDFWSYINGVKVVDEEANEELQDPGTKETNGEVNAVLSIDGE